LAGRKGEWINAIAPVCAKWDGNIETPKFTGNHVPLGALHGGSGGEYGQAVCQNNSLASNLSAHTEVSHGWIYSTSLDCEGDGGKKPYATFRGSLDVGTGPEAIGGIAVSYGLQHCEDGEAAVGIHGVATNVLHSIGLICGAAPSRLFKDTLRAGVELLGNDYKAFATSDAAACMAECEGDSFFCKAWTWLKKESKSCRLKNAVPVAKVNPDAISGVNGHVVAFPFGYTNSTEYDQGNDLPGDDYRIYGEPTAIDCQKACVADGQCKAWSWELLKKQCALKNAVPQEKWEDENYTSGVPGCKSGFTWRLAQPTDHVCAPEASKARVAAENQTGPSLVDPKGAYGPTSCKQGFVWRDAFDGDHVCISPSARDAAAEENHLAPSRKR
jgi:hypothetical protein